MGVAQMTKHGFFFAFFVKEHAVIGVVTNHHQLLSAFGCACKDFGDGLGFFPGGRITGRIIGEIQGHQQLVALVSLNGRFKGFQIETRQTFIKERIGGNGRAQAGFPSQIVVFPHQIAGKGHFARVQRVRPPQTGRG